jgi:hypothetical protein
VSDGHRNLTSDAHVQQLQPGQRVLVRAAQEQEGAVFQVCQSTALTYTGSAVCSFSHSNMHLVRQQQAGMASPPQTVLYGDPSSHMPMCNSHKSS